MGELLPYPLCGEGWAPVPGEGTLLFANEVDMTLPVLDRRGAVGGYSIWVAARLLS